MFTWPSVVGALPSLLAFRLAACRARYTSRQFCVRDGSITNSDVEQFAWFVDHCEKASWVPTGPAGLCEHKYSDNSPTVGWDNRKASSANSTAPSDFIQLAAMVSHAQQRAPGETTHTSGEGNRMADFASRSWAHGSLPKYAPRLPWSASPSYGGPRAPTAARGQGLAALDYVYVQSWPRSLALRHPNPPAAPGTPRAALGLC